MSASELEADRESSLPGMPYFRSLKGLSQTELARRLGITRGTVAKYETGDLKVSVPRAKQIADELECSIQNLLTPQSYDGDAESGTVVDSV